MARIQSQTILFRKPVEVLEVWRSTRLYRKNEVPLSERRGEVEWTPFESPFGTAAPGGLVIGTEVSAAIDPQTTRLLLLVSDHPSTNQRTFYPAGFEAHTGARSFKLDVFRADLPDEWTVLLIPPTYVKPKRTAFSLCKLRPGEPVEIRLNGKADGHHERMYLEWSYLFRRSAPFTQATVAAGPFAVDPGGDHRVVDLRKLLW
ncbi:hypothetical protein [Flaviaesturariibacter aridisoli]|uniref:Uncharacterized protein n=1 Tax=Flaviaesturariibacter aridisoli TaxID=2545761 RepID=A0A4R4DXU4_9BACT|nr:hypothetical protein [Flaviaesturariibacter aridisoli]TCZ68259.1 hypothetical protein E0486_14385 [Flaviaesturariibacter aridisoli]